MRGNKKPLSEGGACTPWLLPEPYRPPLPGWFGTLAGFTRLPGASSGQNPLRLS